MTPEYPHAPLPEDEPTRGGAPLSDEDLEFGVTQRGLAAGVRLFERYEVRAKLGRGGMGVVWQAWDEQLEREVALKFIPEIIVRDRSSIDGLKRETRRALELTHPNIVRIYDFIAAGDQAAISMEYVDGDTLSAVRVAQASRVLEPGQILPWLRQIAAALAYAHGTARIVHRDLKPANIMVNSRGEIKITDFGISRSLSESVSMVSVRSQANSGTLVYMSPQQLMGERGSPGDDIYALGATIYELVAGKPPFYSGNVEMQIKEKLPPKMAERREELGFEGEEIPAHWEEAVARCLEKDPALRPADAMEALALFDRDAGPIPIAATTHWNTATTIAPPTTAPAPRRNAGAIVAFSLLFAALAAGAGWYWGVHLPQERKRIEQEAREDAETEAQQARLAEQQRRKDE
ncbi:MAG: serine/threonine-protein kinase, partial [Chthoniobacterales bacterium]